MTAQVGLRPNRGRTLRTDGRIALILLGFGLLASAASGQETTHETARDGGGLRERLRALQAPPPPVVGLYEDDMRADLARITADAKALFGPERAAIALFVGPDCPRCDKARTELEAVAETLGLRVHVIDTGSDAEAAALMARMTLDTVPSYVMPDRLIRGHMPDFVLMRYLDPTK